MGKQKKQKIEPEPEPEPESEAEEIVEDDEEDLEIDEEDDEEDDDEENDDVDEEDNEEDGDEEDDDEDDDEEDDDEEDDDEEDDDEEDDDEEPDEDELDSAVVAGTRKEDTVDDLIYDGFNLTASSYHPLRWKDEVDRERVLVQTSARVAQLLFKKLKSYPTEPSDVGLITILPSEVSNLPRTMKIPEPKPETKWEKFAREKGILKKKKDRMVYDEAAGEYKPRFGYKGINKGLEDQAIVEIKPGDDPFADPWAEDRKNKKERIEKNKKNQMKNEARNNKKGKKGGEGGGFDPSKMPGIPVDLSNKKKGKAGVRNTLQLVQHSTASMGRFDEMRSGEPARKIIGKKRSFRDNFISTADEKAAMKSQLRFVTDKKDKKARGVTNSLAAYEGILPDAPGNAFKKTKGRGKNSGKPDQKKKR